NGPDGAQLCLFAIGVLMSIGAISLAIERNAYCDPDQLLGVEPPYGGDLLPDRFILSERKQYLKLSKIIDVYDENWVRMGYFYDLNLLFIMRFGYSDNSDRIWFEA
ncbi:Iigp1, partial [Symbiodinium pilosum]